MDGAVPGKVHIFETAGKPPREKPVLIWGFNPVVPADGRRQTYVYVSDPDTGRLSEEALEDVSIDWRLVDGEWVALYEPVEPVSDDEDEDGV